MAGEPYLSEYYQAIDDAAYVWGTDVAEMDRVLSAWDLTPEQVYTDWVDNRSISNGKTKIIAGKDGSLRFRTVDFETNVPSTNVNSNTIVKRQWSVPVRSTINSQTGKVTMKVGLREAGTFVMGKVIPALTAASVGIALGKAIDSALYNANPNFWNENGMESLNPETWNSITGNDTTLGTIFNTIFGLDGDKATMYMDEDDVAYLARYLKEIGALASASIPTDPVMTTGIITSLPMVSVPDYIDMVSAFTLTSSPTWMLDMRERTIAALQAEGVYDAEHVIMIQIVSPSNYNIFDVFPKSSIIGKNIISIADVGEYQQYTLNSPSVSGIKITVNAPRYEQLYTKRSTSTPLLISGSRPYTGLAGSNIGVVVGTDGITNQPNATQPNTTDWTNDQNTKTSLQQQYPDLWNNAKHYDYVDNNGQQKTKTLLPIPLTNTKSPTDTKPTTDDRVQDTPEIDPETETDTLVDTITKIITEKLTPTTPTTNPPDTGSGSSPTVVQPTGEASSLWAVYNPTQAQLDAFGSWLWSSNFVDQIKKLFNDPMQAIVGVHKVFATPETNGQVNIKCGYIDSECPAAKVTSQYKTIDCGTIRLYETFANVFDYPPYTDIRLYLPFIGIVKLDTSDVMRSSINVKYHVDVITGACLADVIVSSDGANSVLYQYSGSAIVTYPISSGSYASAVTGILSLAAGVAGTLMTGGAAAPALIEIGRASV